MLILFISISIGLTLCLLLFVMRAVIAMLVSDGRARQNWLISCFFLCILLLVLGLFYLFCLVGL